MQTVLITAPYIIPVIDRFRPLFDQHNITLIVADVEERLNEDELLAYQGQYDGTICGDDLYSARVLEANTPRLQVISKWGTGIDSINQEAADRLGIQVCNTPDAFTIPVADTVLGYMLAFVRQQPWMDRAMKSGRWQKIPGRSLSECTLGVVGVGNIGKAVIRRASAFEMKLLGNDIIEIDPGFVKQFQVEMTGLEELLGRADFVSLNCDLNPTSRHLINARTLAMMQPSAVLVNAARGPVVDEQALIKALQDGAIAGAARDVFEQEPLPTNSQLLGMDNVMLAPHNANSSPTAWTHVHQNTVLNLLNGLGIETNLEILK